MTQFLGWTEPNYRLNSGQFGVSSGFSLAEIEALSWVVFWAFCGFKWCTREPLLGVNYDQFQTFVILIFF